MNSECRCGETEDMRFEWGFSEDSKTASVVLEAGRVLTFHRTHSAGTAAVLGATPLEENRHHYWELKMTTPVYGTDVMVGVATQQTDIYAKQMNFVSLIGRDEHSWGYSYRGHLYHAADSGGLHDYPGLYGSQMWGEGTIIGVHLDRWRGTVEFYLNRRPLGEAFRGLPTTGPLFPMVSSTAAKSGMRLVCAQSYRCDLAFECVKVLCKSVVQTGGLDGMTSDNNLQDLLPPGLMTFINNNCWFLLGSRLFKSELLKASSLSSEEEGKVVLVRPSQTEAVKNRRQRWSRRLKDKKAGVEGSSSSSDEDDDAFLPCTSKSCHTLRASKTKGSVTRPSLKSKTTGDKKPPRFVLRSESKHK